VWQDDNWYWKEEATDWGYDWREAEKNTYIPSMRQQTAMLEILLAALTIGLTDG
jgi:hypothetical protein